MVNGAVFSDGTHSSAERQLPAPGPPGAVTTPKPKEDEPTSSATTLNPAVVRQHDFPRRQWSGALCRRGDRLLHPAKKLRVNTVAFPSLNQQEHEPPPPPADVITALPSSSPHLLTYSGLIFRRQSNKTKESRSFEPACSMLITTVPNNRTVTTAMSHGNHELSCSVL
ncbi:hypothetical protein SKAU_G00309330 [Synaphobranchus kaupii]|uniref:Uncharacterized protein n=1 Tax=Synaphobranchus kaupii TaxID=118154 RepID=A0A9Q1ERJ5_SYNKA|nr:hypothetical protein SKAU_G00309330 [Synaphobranchus kaupii]